MSHYKVNWWPEDTTPIERGKLAEKGFFKAFENCDTLPKWIVAVCPPTEYEDYSLKTDAIIICICGPNIKIQIKSYELEEDEKINLMHQGVVPITINGKDSAIDIRIKTYKSLLNFNSFLEGSSVVNFTNGKRKHFQRKKFKNK